MGKIKHFYYMVCRMLFWAWAMRNSYDFDYGYVEQTLLVKLKRLHHSMNSCPYHHTKQETVEELKRKDLDEHTRIALLSSLRAHKSIEFAIKILERRMGDCSYYDDISGVTKFYSENDSFFHEVYKGTKAEKAAYFEKLRPLLRIRERLIDRDRKMLYTTISKYSEGWWV